MQYLKVKLKSNLKNYNIFLSTFFLLQFPVFGGGSSLSVEVNMLNSDVVVSDFELQLCSYNHFQTNTLGKGMNSLIYH